jgi:hypothetical protein
MQRVSLPSCCAMKMVTPWLPHVSDRQQFGHCWPGRGEGMEVGHVLPNGILKRPCSDAHCLRKAGVP